MQTTRRKIEMSDGWIQIADGTAIVTIQVVSGTCHLAVATSIPGANSLDYHPLDRWTTLSEEVVAYVRSGSESTTIVYSSIETN